MAITEGDRISWSSRHEIRSDRRLRARCGGDLVIWFGAPIRQFCSVTGAPGWRGERQLGAAGKSSATASTGFRSRPPPASAPSTRASPRCLPPRRLGTVAPRSVEVAPVPGGIDHEHRDTPTAESSAAVVRAHGMARSSSALPTQRRPLPVDHVEQARLGRTAPHGDRAGVRAGVQRHHRLRRGRPQPRRDRDERLGRRPSLVVAQPPGAPRRRRPVGRPSSAPGARARPSGRNAIVCGSAGTRSTHSSMHMPACDRRRRPSSSSNRPMGPRDTRRSEACWSRLPLADQPMAPSWRTRSSTRPAARRVPKNQKVCRVMRPGSRVPGPPPRSAPYLTASAVSGQLIPLPRKRWGYGLAGGLVAG
jgi:hypothetical protein